MKYRFTRDVLVESRRRKKGEVVNREDIPAGSLASMLSVGWVEEVKDDKPTRQTKAKRKPASGE